MLLCTFCVSPSRINFSTVCMPSMHTHSYELWGEGEGTAWTCTDKITKILHQGWELNLLPLPSDFTTRPSLLLPTGTVAQHYRQISGVGRLGERHLAVLKPFGRSAGTGVFCFTLWCSKEGKKNPTLSHRAANPSQFANPICTPAPARNQSVSRLHVSFIKK